MQERVGTWSEVRKDSYIRDKLGKVWKVQRYSVVDVHVIDATDSTKSIPTPPGHAPVTILEPTEGEAEAIIEKAFAVKTRIFEPFGYAMQGDIAWMRSHLVNYHGVENDKTRSVPNSTLSELHDTIAPSIPHTHKETP